MFSKTETNKMKAVGILLLLFHHLFYNPKFVSQIGFKFMLVPQNYVQAMAIMARVCVWIFIFLSAYGLTISYIKTKDTTHDFFVKRYFSLMSGYWFVYIFTAVLLLIAGRNPFAVYEGKKVAYLLDFLGVADLFGYKSISGVWWYMGIAQILLVLIPCLVSFVKKYGLHSVLIIFVLLIFMPEGIKSNAGGYYTSYLIGAVIGVYAAEFDLFAMIKNESNNSVKRVLTAILTLGVIGLLLLIKYRVGTGPLKIGTLITAYTVLLMCYFSMNYIKFKPLNFALNYIGIHSGNMFMIHAVLYGKFPKIIFWNSNAIISFLTLFIVSLLCSIIIEKIKLLIRYDKFIRFVRSRVNFKFVNERINSKSVITEK